MFEKVNPSHPDKIADRIAGALVDYAYAQASFKNTEPQIAVEVLIGHSNCYIITESSIYIPQDFAESVVNRITNSIGIYNVILNQNQQDIFLHDNQMNGFHCGRQGHFKKNCVLRELRLLLKIFKSPEVKEQKQKIPKNENILLKI